MEIRTSHARVRTPWLPNAKSGSPVLCWIGSIRRSRIEVPRVDYEKLSGDRVGESSEAIRGRVQTARNIQNKRFSTGASDIVSNADMHVGEVRQFCRLQEEGQSLMRAAM